jgi:hypothetical protein
MLVSGLLGTVAESRVGSYRDNCCILVISEDDILKLAHGHEFAADFLADFALNIWIG